MTISKGAVATLGSQDGNNTTATVSSAIDTTGAGLLLALFSWEGNDSTPTVSDSKSNTWTLVAKATSAAISAYVYAAYGPTAVGTSHTCQVVPAANRPFKRCGFYAVNGTFANSGALNTSQTGTGASTTIATSANINNTSQPALILQWVVNDNGATNTQTGSWSLGDSDLQVSGRALFSNIRSATGVWTTTFSQPSANNYATVAAAFVETSASGQPSGRRTGLAQGFSRSEIGRDGGSVFRERFGGVLVPAGFHRRRRSGLIVPERRVIHG